MSSRPPPVERPAIARVNVTALEASENPIRVNEPMRIQRNQRVGFVLLALVACASPVLLHAQSVYKSVDTQGNTVFSDRPPEPGGEQQVVNDAPSPPKMVHFCWTNCFTLVESHGIYSRVDGTDETWTVERFTPASFVLMRHDPPAEWNRFKKDVPYAGRVVGERLVDVTVDGLPVSDIRMAWGSALDTLPGSNVERAQGLWPPAEEAPAGGGPLPAADPQPLITATEAPPPLPNEEQPPCETDGSIWRPGYWAWRTTVYYWVPGVWVHPPQVGFLWTPGYWALAGGVFVFHPGFWGPVVGGYGGINYGHGYFGAGYSGGHWVGGRFHYNTAVTNVDASVIRNVYREPVSMGVSSARASYVGGPSHTSNLVTHRARAATTKPPATSQHASHEGVAQAAANDSPTPTAHHHHKSASSTVQKVAQNSAASHSRVTSEVAPTSKPTSSTHSTVVHSSH